MKSKTRKLIFEEEALKGFAKNLKEVRKRYNVSQEELSHRSGVVLSQIARIETVRTNPTISTIFRLAKGLNIHPSELFIDMQWLDDDEHD